MIFSKLLTSLTLVLISLVAAGQALGCQCGARPTVLEEFEYSETVVIARMVSVDKATGPNVDWYQEGIKSSNWTIENVYKSQLKVSDTITVVQGGGADCVFTFREDMVGIKFLFYLPRRSKNSYPGASDDQTMFAASYCRRSGSVAGATDDLAYLSKMEKVRGKSRLSGHIVSSRKDDLNVGGLKIQIIGKDKTFETRTDKTGFYEIYDLPGGVYDVAPQTPSGWEAKVDEQQGESAESQPNIKNRMPVVIPDKRHASLNILFVPDTRLSGKVLSPDGKPMADVLVNADLAEKRQAANYGSRVITNKKGEYSFENLEPGNYILTVNEDGKINEKEPFGRLFYPGVEKRENAGVISVELGKYSGKKNIQITRTVQLIQITGSVSYSDGTLASEVWVNFTPEDAELFSGESVRTDGDGRFSLRLPKGVSGKLVAKRYVRAGEFQNCSKLDALIEASGKTHLEVESSEYKINVTDTIETIELTFPFPLCEKARDQTIEVSRVQRRPLKSLPYLSQELPSVVPTNSFFWPKYNPNTCN